MVSIFGAARQGKSFLMNLLAGAEDMFKISNQRTPCTQGVDLSRSTQSLSEFSSVDGGSQVHDRRTRVVFADAEGQGDRDVRSAARRRPPPPTHRGRTHAQVQYDARLISPVLLLSKVVIFNWKDTVQKDRILSLLGVAAHAAQGIDSTQDDGHCFHHLHIVFRDWNFEEQDPQQVLDDIMTPERGRAHDIALRNEARRMLRESFRSITAWLLPHPVRRASDLRRQISFSDLDPRFRAAVSDLRAKIADQLREKPTFGREPLTGTAAASISRELVRVLNSDEDTILPESVYQTVLDGQARRATAQGLEAARAVVEEARPRFGGGDVQLQDLEHAVRRAASERFDEVAVGVSERVAASHRGALQSEVDALVAQVGRDLEAAASRAALRAADDARDEAVAKVRHMLDALPQDAAALRRAKDEAVDEAVAAFHRAAPTSSPDDATRMKDNVTNAVERVRCVAAPGRAPARGKSTSL